MEPRRDVLDVRYIGGLTCEVVDVTDSNAPTRVEGPFTSEELAKRWIENEGPRYVAMRRQAEAARASEQEEGTESATD